MAPKLSVIIASYNHADYIAETLASLESQSWGDFEIILIDDGSTDKTVEVARTAGSRAQIYTQKNQGVVAARNRGLTLAKGRYVCFVDSDDVVLPQRFEKQIALLEADEAVGMVFADALIIDEAGRETGRFSDVYPVVAGDVAEQLLLHYCFVPMITAMVRLEVLRRTGPFQRPGPISDYIKWIEISHVSKVAYNREALGCWRRHGRSISRIADKEKTYARTRAALKRVLGKYPDLRAKVDNRMDRRFSRLYFLAGFFLAAQGNIERARKHYCKAVKIYPWSLENWGGLMLASLPAKKLIVKIHQWAKQKKMPW